MMQTVDDVVEKYLKRLNSELDDVPRGRRRELVDEISEHIAEARSDLDSQGEAEIRNVLDRLGDPADIADEERERLGIKPKKAGFAETAAVILLPIGGVVLPFLGWVIGVVFLWGSDIWTRREKLLGTFVLPGGFLMPLFFVMSNITHSTTTCFGDGHTETCTTDGPSQVGNILLLMVMILLVLAPIASAAFLARQMRRRSA